METNRSETPLSSWKEIGAYLQRNEATARRWEKEEALPVHRHSHKARSSVYAYPSEIDAWRASRKLIAEPPPPVPLWRSLFATPRSLAFAVTMLACLIMVGNGIRPVSAQQSRLGGNGPARDRGVVVQQVWAAEDAATTQWGDVSLQVSPDGRNAVYYDDNRRGVAVRDLSTGETRFLTHDAGSGHLAYDLVVSPDGKQIAFRWAGKMESQPIRLIGVDGKRMHEIAVGEYGTFLFAWSPDGKQIAAFHYDAQGDKTTEIVLISAADGAITRVKSTGWRFPRIGGFSPDGRFLVYWLPNSGSKPDGGIFAIAVDGSRETPLVQNTATNTYPVWTPDGRAVVFLSDRSGTKDLWRVPVADGRPQGSPELIRPQVGAIDLKGFTRDGSLYYGTNQLETDLYAAEFDPEKLTVSAPARITEQFIGSNYGPEPSPDGTLVAFLRRTPGDTGRGTATLVIRSTATGEERALTKVNPGHYQERSIRWYPDSRSLLLQQRRDKTEFRRIDVETGEERTVLEGDIWSDELSGDGKTLFYSLRGKASQPGLDLQRLMRRDLDTGREKELYRTESRMTGFFGLTLSPDGTRVAFLTQIGEGVRALVTMPESGGELKEIYRAKKGEGLLLNSWGACWTKDGRHLIVTGHIYPNEPTQLLAFPADGGQPRTLTTMPLILNPSISPDGRHILFTGAREKRELWVFRNFLPPSQASR
jgi:Tol biopolymer transport system component